MMTTQWNTEARIRLADGRWLGYTEYGDPAGIPVFLFHGTPGSRLHFLEDDPVASEMGVRLIAPDRPGYGISDPHPTRTLLGWADDVAVLADHLGIERFAVAGASGGGPHVAACAYALSERVTAVAMICSAAPIDAPGAMHGIALGNRAGFFLSRYLPWLMRLLVRAQTRMIARAPERFLRAVERQLCEADRRVLAAPEVREMSIRHLQEAVRAGPMGTLHETPLFSRSWGFDLREIRVPVHLWHGEDDTLAPVTMGRYLAETIPGCRAHFLPGTGHLIAEHEPHWRVILEELVAEAS
jgi:pimeloyl-ACP methyl ester carboxylesterase